VRTNVSMHWSWRTDASFIYLRRRSGGLAPYGSGERLDVDHHSRSRRHLRGVHRLITSRQGGRERRRTRQWSSLVRRSERGRGCVANSPTLAESEIDLCDSALHLQNLEVNSLQVAAARGRALRWRRVACIEQRARACPAVVWPWGGSARCTRSRGWCGWTGVNVITS